MLNTLQTLVFSTCSLCVALTQAEPATQDQGIGVYVDQDLFIPFTNEDRDYTMGLAFEFFWAKEKGLYPLDNAVKHVGNWLGIENTDNNIVYSFMLGTLAYTPDDLSSSAPIYNDRPYASLIYLGNKRIRADQDDALAAEVAVGVLGTDIAYQVQSQFHQWYRDYDNSTEPVEPMGWEHQVSNGGEITLRMRLSKSQLHDFLSIPGIFDVSSTVGFSLGFQTNISVSAAIRLGHIKSPFWSLPYDPVNRGNFLPARAISEWYFWGAYRAHLVGYDALLQGQFRDSTVTFSYDEIEHVVYDGAMGFTWGFGQSQLTFSANTKSSELKLTDRKQTWGSVNYIYHF